MAYQVFLFKNDLICYEFETFNSISINKQTPVSPMPLPEEDSEENVLMKIEGNTTTMSLNWTLTNASTSIAKCSYGQIAYVPSMKKYVKLNIQTDLSGVFDQVSYIEHDLAPNSLNDFYSLYILDSDVVTKADAMIYTKVGLIQDFSFNTDASSPVNWQATMNFIEGAVVTSMSENSHQPPTMLATPASPKFTIQSGTSGSTLQRTGITISFQEFQNYAASDRPITTGLSLRYKKTDGGTFWTEKTLDFSANTSAPYNYTKTLVISDLASPASTPSYSGTYDIRLAINTIGGRGEWLKITGGTGNPLLVVHDP